MEENNGTVGQATDENITWRMHVACWITKATNTRSDYEYLLLFAQQGLTREGVSMLRYRYIARLV